MVNSGSSSTVELVVTLAVVVVDNCLMEIVEDMEVTTDVVDTVTEWEEETMDFEVVVLTLKFFFFLSLEAGSVVVVACSVVVLSPELKLRAPSQDMSFPL